MKNMFFAVLLCSQLSMTAFANKNCTFGYHVDRGWYLLFGSDRLPYQKNVEDVITKALELKSMEFVKFKPIPAKLATIQILITVGIFLQAEDVLHMSPNLKL